MTTTATITLPMPPGARTMDHLDADHGFCVVCGAVWPCARARRELGEDDASRN